MTNANSNEEITDSKSTKVISAWMWFTRLNIIIIPFLLYFLITWMQHDPNLNVNFFFQLALVVGIIAILFILHYTSFFPLVISLTLAAFSLTSSSSVAGSLPSIQLAILELIMAVIAAPLVYFHVNHVFAETDDDESFNTKEARSSTVVADNEIDESADGQEQQELGLMEELMTGFTLIEMLLLGMLGIILAILFYFSLASVFLFLRVDFSDVLSLFFVIGFIFILFLVVTFPLTIATRFVPEVIIRKILLKELPLDLMILLGAMLLLGATTFVVALLSAVVLGGDFNALLAVLSTSWILILILSWGLLFHGGTIIAWVKKSLASVDSLVDLEFVELSTIFPVLLGLYLFVYLSK